MKKMKKEKLVVNNTSLVRVNKKSVRLANRLKKKLSISSIGKVYEVAVLTLNDKVNSGQVL